MKHVNNSGLSFGGAKRSVVSPSFGSCVSVSLCWTLEQEGDLTGENPHQAIKKNL